MRAPGTDHVGPAARSMSPAAVLLGILAIVEVLAFGPASGWMSPRLWLVQLAGTSVVVGLAGLLAWMLASLPRGLGRTGLSATDLALCFAASASCTAHTWRFLDPHVHAVVPWLPGYAAILASLGLLACAFHLILVLARRLRLARPLIVPLLAGVLAVPVLVDAMAKTATSGADRRGLRVPALALAILLLATVVVTSLRARRHGWVVISGVLALAVLVLRMATINPHDLHVLTGPPAVKAPGPPVLLIVLDTFRADALDLKDPSQSRTPNMSRLARDSDVYVNAVANASWTLPGHASILTGRLVSQHHVDITSEPGYSLSLDRRIPTAQELFGREGYRTSCIVANPGLDPGGSNLLRGCQRYQNPGRAWILSLLPLRLADLASPSSRRFILPQVIVETTGINVHATSREIVDTALAELPATPSPLYLFLNFMDVHLPYPADAGTPLTQRAQVLGDMVLYLGGRLDIGTIWQRHAPTLRSYYDERAGEIDRQVGRLLDELRARGWYDRMAIVVTADHGEAFRENPSLSYYFAHHGAYEPAVRIPLLVKKPGQRVGAVFEQAVQQVDILPTLLALTDLPPVQGVFGRELGTEPDDVVVTEWYPRLDGPDGLLPYERAAIYDGAYKYVRAGGVAKLYDLQQSPYETVDVIERRPEMAARLAATLSRVIDTAGRTPAPGETDPRVLERLRSLGYVK